MKVLKSIFTIILLCCVASVYAQHRLERGSEIPDLPAMPILHYNNSTYEYSGSEGKVTILDFFDTYCSSCIRSMPRLQQLQKEMGDKLELIMVTWQDKETIEKFYASNAFLKDKEVVLPTVVSDTLLRKYFPHQSVPHSIWIYNNKLMSASFSDFINKSNIESLLGGEPLEIPQKDDFSVVLVDKIAKEEEHGDSTLQVNILFSGYNPILQPIGLSLQKDTVKGGYVSYFNNLDVLGAFTSTWTKIRRPKYLLLKERIEWNVKNSERYFHDKLSDVPHEVWLSNNALTYKRWDKKQMADSLLARKVLNDLSNFLDIETEWGHRKRKCLVLKKIKRVKCAVDSTASSYEGTEMLAFMMDYSKRYPPVIDEANVKETLLIPSIANLDELNAHLKCYGLVIKEEWRDIEVLIFKEQ